MTEQRQVEFVRDINATPEAVYRALTHPLELPYWFCHYAWTEPKPGGEFLVRWRNGWWARGLYESVEKPRRVAFTWQGKDEPGETTAVFEVEPLDQGARVKVTHGGYGDEAVWDKAVYEAEKSWPMALENLESVLTTGIDLREANRPMLGIVPEELTVERAAKEDIATESGIYLNSVLENDGAAAAGLQKGDVITSLGGMAVTDFDSLTTTLASYRAGDRVQVGYVRGRQRGNVMLELKARAMPEFPSDPQQMAEQVRQEQKPLFSEYRELLAGVSEELAARKPAPDEWSAKETLAHLVVGERFTQRFLVDVIAGATQGQFGDVNAVTEVNAMVFSLAPTVDALLALWEQECESTLTLFGALRPEVVAMKARYRQMATALSFWGFHTRDHLSQIRAALKA